MTHHFFTSLKQGELGEAQLDKFFSKQWAIAPATIAQQNQGIDRCFYDLRSNQFAFTVEYKFDSMAAKTGNAFIELGSFGAIAKLGWVYTCSADRIFYTIAGDLLVYELNPVQVRAFLPGWLRKYSQSVKAVSNNRDGTFYSTIGLLVPLRELEAIAQQVVSM